MSDGTGKEPEEEDDDDDSDEQVDDPLDIHG
jgi:hypothetical protein